jgi:hypothetical protein
MARKRRNPDSESPRDKDDVTHELTGNDAPLREAEAGSVGPGGDSQSADDIEEQFHLEDDPSHAEDIAPDQFRRQPSNRDDEDREYTALPKG